MTDPINENFPQLRNIPKEQKSIGGPRDTLKRAYTKVSTAARRQLIRNVIEGELTIKDASKKLGINYSAAKNIIKVFRKREHFSELSHDPNEVKDLSSNSKRPELITKRFSITKVYPGIEPTQSMTQSAVLSHRMKANPFVDVTSSIFDFSLYSEQIYNTYLGNYMKNALL